MIEPQHSNEHSKSTSFTNIQRKQISNVSGKLIFGKSILKIGVIGAVMFKNLTAQTSSA